MTYISSPTSIYLSIAEAKSLASKKLYSSLLDLLINGILYSLAIWIFFISLFESSVNTAKLFFTTLVISILFSFNILILFTKFLKLP